jgi:hypothetical protein
MELSGYVAALRRELATITRFAGDDITRAAEMLTEALDSPVRLTLLDVLSAAAAEITTELHDTAVDVRLSAGEPEFVVTTTPEEAHRATGPGGLSFSWSWPKPPAAPGQGSDSEEAGTSRITLRLSEQLKAAIEAEASASRQSVNSWLVNAAVQALESGDRMPPGAPRHPRPPKVGNRLTGYARS